MKKLSSFLPSFILTFFLIFTIIGSSASLIAYINFTADKCEALAEKEHLEQKILTELEKYYKDKYNSSGIPADVYMDALSEDYIISFEKIYITAGFDTLSSGALFEANAPENQELENSIEAFFSNYAEENGYEKDENYNKKLDAAKKNAYSVIGSYCDVFKFSAMDKHGVLDKIRPVYSMFGMTAVVLSCANGVLLVLLLLVNRKKKANVLYWTGIAALVSGALGAIPSAYLIASKYYNSFSIKQPQIFTAFTKAMYGLTEAFMASQIAIIVIGICLTVVYGVVHGKKRVQE